MPVTAQGGHPAHHSLIPEEGRQYLRHLAQAIETAHGLLDGTIITCPTCRGPMPCTHMDSGLAHAIRAWESQVERNAKIASGQYQRRADDATWSTRVARQFEV